MANCQICTIASQTVGRVVEKADTDGVLATFWAPGLAVAEIVKFSWLIAFCKVYMIARQSVGRAVEKAEINGVFGDFFARPVLRDLIVFSHHKKSALDDVLLNLHDHKSNGQSSS